MPASLSTKKIDVTARSGPTCRISKPRPPSPYYFEMIRALNRKKACEVNGYMCVYARGRTDDRLTWDVLPNASVVGL